MKQFIATFLSIGIFVIAYYGSVLPIQKSQHFIAAFRKIPEAKTFDQFEDIMKEVFAYPSPIGQEEILRSAANNTLNLVNSANPDPQLVRRALDFIEAHFAPILVRGRGMSFAQDLYVLGTFHQAALVKIAEYRTKEAYAKAPQDVKKAIDELGLYHLTNAKKYYEQGLAMNPKRPQFLFGLFDIYRAENNLVEARRIGERILELWKDESGVQRIMDGFPKPTTDNLKQ